MLDTKEKPFVRYARWKVRAIYRTESGEVDVIFDIEELEELQDLIERGPAWQALERIEIEYRGLPERLTIEEAERQ